MPKANDTRTPEEIQAAKDKMARVRAARNKHNEEKTPTPPDAVVVPREEFQALLDEVRALKEEPKSSGDEALSQLARMLGGNGPAVGRQGVQGAVELASTNPNDYEDPTERLYAWADNDARLSRYNVRDNYKIIWKVESDSYRRDGVAYRYPRFICELGQLRFNADGSPMIIEEKGKLYHRAKFRGRQIMKAEDEVDVQTAIQKLGLELDDRKDMLNEFRFWRLTEWLAEKILPIQAIEYENDTKEEVIDGELVQIRDYEIKPKNSVFGG